MATVSSLLVSLAGPLAKKVLTSLGFGVLSYTAVKLALDAAQSALISSYGSISADLSGVLNMAGFGDAIGIILGALAARLSAQSLTRLGMLSK